MIGIKYLKIIIYPTIQKLAMQFLCLQRGVLSMRFEKILYYMLNKKREMCKL